MVYNLYETQGGEGLVMQEGKLLFAQIIASRITGYPLEAIYKIKAKDSVTLKNRVYRFFLPCGIAGLPDIREMNRTFISAGRYSRSGPQFFLMLPLPTAIHYVQDTIETARQEREIIKNDSRKRR